MGAIRHLVLLVAALCALVPGSRAVVAGALPTTAWVSGAGSCAVDKSTYLLGGTVTVTGGRYGSNAGVFMGCSGAIRARIGTAEIPPAGVTYYQHFHDANPRPEPAPMYWIKLPNDPGAHTVEFDLAPKFAMEFTTSVRGGVTFWSGPFAAVSVPSYQQWTSLAPFEVIGGDVAVDVESETKIDGQVLPGETIRYTIEAEGSGRVKTLQIDMDAPKGTAIVAGSADQGAVQRGNRLTWNFKDQTDAKVQFDAEVLDAAALPRTLDAIRAKASAAVTFTGGNDRATDDDELTLGTLVLEAVDGSARDLGGQMVPDPQAPTLLPAFGWTFTRPVKGVAADGVTLLLLRAAIRDAKHGKVVFKVEETEHGAPPGSLWKVDDVSLLDVTPAGGARDQRPAEPAEVEVESAKDPQSKNLDVAFALYRAPRDFDAGGGTAGLQSRPIRFLVDLYDEDDATVLTTTQLDFDVVRPLVILQHGTFDSPAGWVKSPLFTETGNDQRLYAGHTSTFPFQTDRGSFHAVENAAGPLIASAQVAWNTLQQRVDAWRRATEYAGTQVDVVCHSYGGVNLRWIAQMQADADPMTLDTSRNFRNASNWGHGAVHKLITIASTHRGSCVSNQLAFLNHYGRLPGLLRWAAEREGAPIDRGAVEDQMVVSPRLLEVAETRVPGHAVAGSGLCEHNPTYEKRLFLLWVTDDYNGPFKTLGLPYGIGPGRGVPNYSVFRALSNYGFNLSQALRDDATQDPNYDLTVSSRSSKGGMPPAAQSTPADIEAAGGAGPLVGRLTHGDQIAEGNSDPAPPRAVALRIAHLLRQPTASSSFAFFPAVAATPLAAAEQEFSDTTAFDPAWLYETGNVPFSVTDLPAKRAAQGGPRATVAPVVTLVPDVAVVAPGQQIQVTVAEPVLGVGSAYLVWAGSAPGDGEFVELAPDALTTTVTVPDRRPGRFILGVLVLSPLGVVSGTDVHLEIADAAGYTELRTSSDEFVLRGTDPCSIGVEGKLASGAWRELDASPRLVFASSDPAVVTVGPRGLLRPHGFGTATLTATYDGTLATTVAVTVAGETVAVAAKPKSRGKLARRSRSPADFVFLSGPGFDPADVDRDSVLVGGRKPLKFKTTDVNRDGVPDLAAFVRPRDLGLAKGPASVPMAAVLASGVRVAGIARATAK